MTHLDCCAAWLHVKSRWERWQSIPAVCHYMRSVILYSWNSHTGVPYTVWPASWTFSMLSASVAVNQSQLFLTCWWRRPVAWYKSRWRMCAEIFSLCHPVFVFIALLSGYPLHSRQTCTCVRTHTRTHAHTHTNGYRDRAVEGAEGLKAAHALPAIVSFQALSQGRICTPSGCSVTMEEKAHVTLACKSRLYSWHWHGMGVTKSSWQFGRWDCQSHAVKSHFYTVILDYFTRQSVHL